MSWSDHDTVIGSTSPEAIEFGRLTTKSGITSKMRYGGERHTLVFGANGSGKGTRILLPNLLNMGGKRSIVVVDPKGELAAVSAPYRRTIGKVVILNPFGVLTDYRGYDDMAGVGFNPLAALDPYSADFSKDVSLLAEAMIPVEGKDPHWSLSARALISALIGYEVIQKTLQRRIPTIGNVRAMLCQPSEEARPAYGIEARGIPKLAEEMARCAIPGLRNKAAQFVNWNNEIQSIASTARTQTECFDDPQIADNLARNDFDFGSLKREPTTVYLVLPPEMMSRHGKWLRLLLSSALQASMRPRQADEPRILFMLDEFAALGHLQIIEDNWALARGYGIQIMPVFQDLNQLKAIYDKRWETFVGNAGVITSFAPNDSTTAEWLSKRMGQRTVLMTTTSQSNSYNKGSNQGTSNNWGSSSGSTSGANSSTSSGSSSGGGKSSGESEGWSESSNSNTSPINVPVMLPQELYGLEAGYMVVVSAGLSNAAPAYAPAYYEIRTRLGRARENPYIHNVARYPAGMRNLFASRTPPAGAAGDDADDWPDVSTPTDNIFNFAPSPAPPNNKPGSNARPPGQDTINERVQARHPGYTPEPPKRVANGNPASRHPGYTPDPPQDDRGNSDGEGGDGWEWADE